MDRVSDRNIWVGGGGGPKVMEVGGEGVLPKEKQSEF